MAQELRRRAARRERPAAQTHAQTIAEIRDEYPHADAQEIKRVALREWIGLTREEEDSAFERIAAAVKDELPDRRRVNLVFESYGENKIAVIKVVKDYFDMRLSDGKNAVKAVRSLLLANKPPDEVADLRDSSKGPALRSRWCKRARLAVEYARIDERWIALRRGAAVTRAQARVIAHAAIGGPDHLMHFRAVSGGLFLSCVRDRTNTKEPQRYPCGSKEATPLTGNGRRG